MMTLFKRFSAALMLMVAVSQANAIVDGHEYQFNEGSRTENESRAQLFQQLAEELRCPKCQNQNLADSNAMIAGDLRRELYSQVKQGKTEQDIIDFMVDRYGEFVLYRPAMNEKTMVLWYGPVALLVLALAIFAAVVFKRRRGDKKASESANSTTAEDVQIESISDEEEQRIAQLLQKADTPSDKAEGKES